MTFRTINNYTADYSLAGTVDLPRALRSTTSAGAQYYRNYYERTCAAGSQFPAVGVTTVDATTTGRSTCQDVEEDATVGLFAQEQLGWNDKLFVTAALRADDNSAFGRNFDRVYYPKFSLSYIPIEGADSRIPYVNALKLRAAYGESGKQPITFSALQAYASATGPGDVPAVTPSTIGNPDLGPERSKEVELGFDLGAFNDRAGAEVTYYRKRTVDAILDRQIAPSIGIPGTQPFNVGSIRNSGLELALRGRPIEMKNVEWDVSVSYATNDNKIENLGTPASVLELRRQTSCPGYVPGTSNPDSCPVADFVVVASGLAPRHQVGYPIGSYFIPKIATATVNANGTVSGVLCDDGKGGTIACASAPALFAGRTTPRVEGAVDELLHPVQEPAPVRARGLQARLREGGRQPAVPLRDQSPLPRVVLPPGVRPEVHRQPEGGHRRAARGVRERCELREAARDQRLVRAAGEPQPLRAVQPGRDRAGRPQPAHLDELSRSRSGSLLPRRQPRRKLLAVRPDDQSAGHAVGGQPQPRLVTDATPPNNSRADPDA